MNRAQSLRPRGDAPAPTVVFEAPINRTVIIDFGTLVAIEDAIGRSIFDLAGEIAAMNTAWASQRMDAKDSNTLGAGDLIAMIRRIKIGTASRVLAAAFGVSEQDLWKIVPTDLFVMSYIKLAPALLKACVELAGGDRDDEAADENQEQPPAHPTSAPSAPGASQSLGSHQA